MEPKAKESPFCVAGRFPPRRSSVAARLCRRAPLLVGAGVLDLRLGTGLSAGAGVAPVREAKRADALVLTRLGVSDMI